KRPLGEVLDFLITFGGVTVPINVVVIDTESYSAIFESDSTDTLKQRRSSELKKENSTTSGDLVLINQG
ncbi:415_t:CDS:2, partial [Rhizophagus irregularis]